VLVRVLHAVQGIEENDPVFEKCEKSLALARLATRLGGLVRGKSEYYTQLVKSIFSSLANGNSGKEFRSLMGMITIDGLIISVSKEAISKEDADRISAYLLEKLVDDLKRTSGMSHLCVVRLTYYANCIIKLGKFSDIPAPILHSLLELVVLNFPVAANTIRASDVAVANTCAYLAPDYPQARKAFEILRDPVIVSNASKVKLVTNRQAHDSKDIMIDTASYLRKLLPGLQKVEQETVRVIYFVDIYCEVPTAELVAALGEDALSTLSTDQRAQAVQQVCLEVSGRTHFCGVTETRNIRTLFKLESLRRHDIVALDISQNDLYQVSLLAEKDEKKALELFKDKLIESLKFTL
jgi:hypothetical protein